MIITFNSSLILLLSTCAILLGVGLTDTTYRICRRWKKSGMEEKYELEKGFYLVLAAACIVLAIRLLSIPLFFLTMQSFVPAVPGAVCLWGVSNALPELTRPATRRFQRMITLLNAQNVLYRG
jgi:hypothetical protein